MAFFSRTVNYGEGARALNHTPQQPCTLCEYPLDPTVVLTFPYILLECCRINEPSRACGRAGKWELALALMEEMRSAGVEPSEGCHVMALKACATAGLWEKALEMLRDMRASGVNRSENSYVVAMKACGDAGEWKEALALMDDMRRDGVPPMETTYTTAVRTVALRLTVLPVFIVHDDET